MKKSTQEINSQPKRIYNNSFGSEKKIVNNNSLDKYKTVKT
jgi:hypothetical protein